MQDQKSRELKYCQQNDIEVIGHYQDDHSAKNFNRPAFQQFLARLKAKTIKPDLFICVRPDRFSRNFAETLSMIQTFTLYGVKLLTLENHVDLNSPEALIPYMLNHVLPQVDNERRSLNTARGMRQAAREGRWVWRAPIGYRNDPVSKSIVVNETIAPLVIEAFELYGMGVYAAEEVRLMMRKKGLVCCKQNFLNMLENLFYSGRFKLRAWKDQPEEIIYGNHEPLISIELFESVQEFLHGKKRKQVSVSATRREELEFRGFLQCKCCGKKLTGSGSQSRNGDIHFYYHCQNGCKERFRADTAKRDFVLFLNGITPPKELIELYHLVLKDTFGADTAKKEADIRKYQVQIEQTEKRLSSLTDKFVDELINGDTYTQKSAVYNAELTLSKDSIKMLETQEDSFGKYLSLWL